MKQLVFRIFDPKIPVIQVILGDLIDGEFKPETDDLPAKLRDLLGGFSDVVRYDEYFGNTPFIKACDFSSVFSFVMPSADNIEFLPGILVLTLKSETYGSSKEEE